MPGEAYRTAHVGPLTLYSSEVPAHSSLIRIGAGNDLSYNRMILVTERDGGRELFLQGWVGDPLTPKQWREAGAALFPDAVKVVFERKDGDAVRVAVLPI